MALRQRTHEQIALPVGKFIPCRRSSRTAQWRGSSSGAGSQIPVLHGHRESQSPSSGPHNKPVASHSSSPLWNVHFVPLRPMFMDIDDTGDGMNRHALNVPVAG